MSNLIMGNKSKKCDEFKLIQGNFHQNQNAIQIHPKIRKKLYYKEFELLQDHNFEDQMYADGFYEENKFVPYFFFIFSSDSDENQEEEKIKSIFIRILKSSIYKGKFSAKDQNQKRKINKNLKLHQFFSRSFLRRLGINRMYDKFPMQMHFSSLNDRKKGWRSFYVFDFIYYLFENIWNEYCLIEGKTSIYRDSFLLWLYRLNSIINDLFEFPFLETNDYQWQLRYIFIRSLLKDKNTEKYEYYCEENWAKLLDLRFTREMATQARILDTKNLLNVFHKEIKPINALERFLICFYNGFGNKLCKDKLLARCHFCNDYIKYKKGKKYCSLSIEGKDCGKKARNKRYYEKRGKKRLEKYRRSTRELREFYREKGIKK
ncbi:MAG: hypothetical protein ACTSWX_05375 [Promethearchaeota archaeon]